MSEPQQDSRWPSEPLLRPGDRGHREGQALQSGPHSRGRASIPADGPRPQASATGPQAVDAALSPVAGTRLRSHHLGPLLLCPGHCSWHGWTQGRHSLSATLSAAGRHDTEMRLWTLTAKFKYTLQHSLAMGPWPSHLSHLRASASSFVHETSQRPPHRDSVQIQWPTKHRARRPECGTY